MRTTLFLASVFLGMLLGGAALALDWSDYETPETRMFRHIEFITSNSDLEYDGQRLPGVEYVSRWTLISLLRPDVAAVCELERDYECSPMGGYLGAYDSMTMWVNAEAGMNLAEIDAVIMHETVHYLQELAGHATRDDGTGCSLLPLEIQAYDLGYLYQESVGFESDIVTSPALEMAMWKSHCSQHGFGTYK